MVDGWSNQPYYHEKYVGWSNFHSSMADLCSMLVAFVHNLHVCDMVVTT